MKRALILSTLAMMAAGVALAGTQDDAVVALHDKVHNTKATQICPGLATATDPNTLGINCFDYSTDNAPLGAPGSDVYLVVANADPGAGIAGLSCGVSFPVAIGMFGFTLCADLQFPNGGWPADGGGNRITWAAGTNCQNGAQGGVNFGAGDFNVHAIAGSFYVYAYGNGVLTIGTNENLVIPEFRVADCDASESDVQLGGGAVGYGTETGYNPCQNITPVEETTWGAIKGNLE